MSLVFVKFVHLVVVFTIIWQNAPSSAVYLEIDPKDVHERITDEVSITCLANDSPHQSDIAILMFLGKSGEHPLATLSKGQPIQYGVNRTSNMQAQGSIETNASNSFLRLTIKKPSYGDAGSYSCQMNYLTQFGVLKKGEAYANMTVDNHNDKGFNHLLKTVSQKSGQLDDLEVKLERQEKIIINQGKQIKDQQERIKKLGTEDDKTKSDFIKMRTRVSDLTNQVSDLRKQVSDLMKQVSNLRNVASTHEIKRKEKPYVRDPLDRGGDRE